jgi:transcriptional regulator with XRE-family HTH domain
MLDLEPIRRKREARRTLPSPALCRELRLQAQLSQQDIADALGVHRESVSRWERGERSPRGDLLLNYVDVLRSLASQS